MCCVYYCVVSEVGFKPPGGFPVVVGVAWWLFCLLEPGGVCERDYVLRIVLCLGLSSGVVLALSGL